MDGSNGPDVPEIGMAGSACERCGLPEAEIVIGDRSLCLDCYYLAGSCCLEFGGDDLWREKEQDIEKRLEA